MALYFSRSLLNLLMNVPFLPFQIPTNVREDWTIATDSHNVSIRREVLGANVSTVSPGMAKHV